MYAVRMQSFQITFLFPTDGTPSRSQSMPYSFEAKSVDHAKGLADAMIERESLTHRTVNVAVLTRTEDQLMEVTRWVRNGGWMEA
jgi:hypothetical protein